MIPKNIASQSRSPSPLSAESQLSQAAKLLLIEENLGAPVFGLRKAKFMDPPYWRALCYTDADCDNTNGETVKEAIGPKMSYEIYFDSDNNYGEEY